MTDTNFKPRYIRVIIGIGTGQQGMGDPTEATTYTLDNYRVEADINAYGGETQGEAHVRIYGLTASKMNQLTTIGWVLYQLRAKNSIQILAGDDPKALSTIYFGSIQTAYADYNNAPDVYLDIMATSAAVAAMDTAKAYHYKGTIAVSQVMNTIANNMKWEFVNVDVGPDQVITDPRYDGSYFEQIKAVARDTHIDYAQTGIFKDSVLRIKNINTAFPDPIQIISPNTNMLGYPVFSQSLTFLKTLFMPNINMGGRVQVKDSIVTPANRKWLVITVSHTIESLVPNGKWQTTLGVMPDDLNTAP